MLPELAGAGAGALVAAMATDVWQGVRGAVMRLYRRRGEEEQATVEGQLHHHDLTVQRADDPDQARQLLLGQWQRDFAQLLNDHPDAAAELRDLVEQIRRELPEGRDHWVQTNIARDQGIVYGVQGGNVNHYHQGLPPSPGSTGGDGQ